MDGAVVEGVEDDVASIPIVVTGEIASVGVCNDGAIASLECAFQQFADGGGFACAGGADEFEVFCFVFGGDGDAGQAEDGLGSLSEPPG